MPRNASTTRFIFAFIAGFVAVLLFHQGMLGLLHTVNLTPRPPFSTKPTQPLGVPQFWSSAFWGGVWGMVFAAVEPRFPKGIRYWVAALLFGALGPTLVSWFVVMPLKGQPVAGGWQPAGMVTGLLVNGAWGLGTALLFLGLSKWQRSYIA
jgi:hypothetical protein